jgi:hypothetical protein
MKTYRGSEGITPLLNLCTRWRKRTMTNQITLQRRIFIPKLIGHPGNQEIPCTVWIQKVQYRLYKNPPFVRNFNQKTQVHTPECYLLRVYRFI